MKPHDVRLLCTALGFTAIVSREGKVSKKEAVSFAKLIEDFCQSVVPEAFEAANGNGEGDISEASNPESQMLESVVQRMAEAIVEVYKEQNGCLPQDLIAKGLTPEEVDRHWAMAWALAKVRMNMSDS
jgi:hypothetical protein